MHRRVTPFVGAAVLGSLVAVVVNVIPMSGGLALPIAGVVLVLGVVVAVYADARQRERGPRPHGAGSVELRH